MTETQLYIQRLFEAEPLRAPVLRSIIQSLNLPSASCGLDIGCGVGLQSLLLAEAAGPDGRVTGLDILPDLLKVGEDLAAKAGLSGRVRFEQGDFNHLPFPDAGFDWVWSADCIGYPTGDLAPVLSELARVVRPGGSIHLLAWTSQQLMPGYPLLEARLNADCSSYTPYLKGQPPDVHFLRGLHALRKAGFEGVRAQTFVRDVQGPLSSQERAALLSLFAMLWGLPQPGIPEEDLQTYRRLCDPQSADCILDHPDYYAFFTYTVLRGTVPAGPGSNTALRKHPPN